MPKTYEKQPGALTLVKRRAQVLLALHQRPQSAATLSETTGLSVPAVDAALAVLVRRGRALSRAGGYVQGDGAGMYAALTAAKTAVGGKA